MQMMKTFLQILLILGGLLLWGCGSGIKSIYTPEQIALFRDVINGKSYTFLANTANPTMTNGISAVANSGLWPPGGTFSNILLQGNDNYLIVKGDSISADLPYFGERQMGGGYDSNAGISFKGIPSRYKEEYDDSKNQMHITFTISEKLETYQVTLSVFPNNKASVVINSSQRFPIRYLGDLKEQEAKESVGR